MLKRFMLWSKKESVGRCRCQSSTRHRQTPLTRNWTTHTHAETYKASPLVWGWIIQAQRRRFWLPQYPLSYENWRFSLIGIEAKHFQIICLAKCNDVAYAHTTHNAIANIWIYLWNAKQIITFSFAYFKNSNKPQKGLKKSYYPIQHVWLGTI